MGEDLPPGLRLYVRNEVLNGLFYSVIVFVVWYCYFADSKRVKATFFDA